jgi:hypothetical protein
MLRFFGKIRRQLAADNDIPKYLRYAVGEILLVVIGILIALQINNLNELRKQKISDISFLESMRSEIVLDTSLMFSRISHYESINEDIEKAVDILNDTLPPSKSETEHIASVVVQLEILVPLYKNITRNDFILASGTLNRIDPELNQKYLSYLDLMKFGYDLTNKVAQSLQSIVINNVYSKVKLNLMFSDDTNVQFDIKKLRKDQLFINAFHESVLYRNVTLVNSLNHPFERAKEVLSDIDSYIEINNIPIQTD